MNATVVTYLVYIVLSVGLTVWVGRTLTRHGDTFLVDVFHGEERIAAATNRLLVVGFYLVNLGFVALMLGVGEQVESAQQAIEVLAPKLGGVALLLGMFHLANVGVLNSIRRRRSAPAQPVYPAYPAPSPHAGPWAPPAYGGPVGPGSPVGPSGPQA